MIQRSEKISRRLLLKQLKSMGQGKGMINIEGVEWHCVQAFRLEPLDKPQPGTGGHIMTVDGEKIKHGPVQAYILPKSVTLL